MKSRRANTPAQPTRRHKRNANRAKRPDPATRDPYGLVIRAWWKALLLGAASLAMWVVIFAPIDWWPFAFVCFVPWLVLVGASESPRRAYVVSYFIGLLFFCITIYWLFIVTVPGALVLFAAFGFYLPLVACPVRHLVRRRGWPLAFTFPVFWVGFEAVRSICILEFPWNLLGHSQHTVLTMIQISDLVGAYGVSFVLATVNGALADLVFCRYGWPAPELQARAHKSPRASLVFAAILLLATILYGQVQLHRNTTSDGPRIAIVQGNYPNYVDPGLTRQQPNSLERARQYFAMLDAAAAEQPDLYLLPETAWPMTLNKEFLEAPAEWIRKDGFLTYLQGFSQDCFDALREFAMTHVAYLVTGSASIELTPFDLRARELRYNSAFVFSPDGGELGRYDKNHLVLIGEYAPFRFGPLRFLYLWINRIVPFYQEDYEYSLSPGTEFNTFTMRAKSQGGKEYGFATPICYENVMPYVSRRFVTGSGGKKRCDFLLNLSNDGWFLHSAELPQHLAASVFRAVENRVGVARAVNTGISCFVDPDGRVHHVVEKDGVAVGEDVSGFRVAPVRVDRRQSLYSRYGDVFAIACAIVWAAFYLDYIAIRAFGRRSGKEETT